MTRGHPLVREAVLSAAAAALLAALLAWFGPPGTDLAAHLYQRSVFLEHGFTLWNNFWYAGRYSFVTYSLLYYPLAALLGIKLLAVATIALAALGFAVVLWHEWGPATRWSSRTFAVVWAGIVLSAAFPFALGFAIALLSLWALQAGKRWRFAALAALTLAASPLAFLLLLVVLAGVVLARRGSLRSNWVPIVGVALASLVELVLWRLFPGGGRFPFSATEFAAGITFASVCLALTWRVESARVLRFFFAVYALALVLAFVIPSSIGENVVRLRFAAIPLTVLVFSLRRWEPRVVGVAALALAVSWNLTPLMWSWIHGAGDATAHADVWRSPVDFLRANLKPSYRVEAVDTSTHSAAAYLAEAGIPLARGWYRQDDFPVNEVLYDDFGARAYLRWLHSLGVKYVVLPDGPSDYSSHAEAHLVRSGRAGLTLVFATADISVYEVPHARSIVTGPGHPWIRTFDESKIGVVLTRGGTYRIAVRYSPYWRTSAGCLAKGRDGMIRLTTRRARVVRMKFSVNASRALDEFAGNSPVCRLR
ncbi:MAG TPA: hypothetical protein VFA56_11355 [Gaiellaceae bacterium]|nr:hypothetical protein [Gaiellaceae bacterium]